MKFAFACTFAASVPLIISMPTAAIAADVQAPGASPSQDRAATTNSDEARDNGAIIVTGARTRLPATALPLTVDVLGGEDMDGQVAVSGSVIDAVSARMPSFSPTREKLSGSGESLRGRSPLYAINGVPQSTPTASPSSAPC